MFYAVAIGKEPGIYKSWIECKAQVNGIKGAKFRKFDTEQECIEFINNTSNNVTYKPITSNTSTKTSNPILNYNNTYHKDNNANYKYKNSNTSQKPNKKDKMSINTMLDNLSLTQEDEYMFDIFKQSLATQLEIIKNNKYILNTNLSVQTKLPNYEYLLSNLDELNKLYLDTNYYNYNHIKTFNIPYSSINNLNYHSTNEYLDSILIFTDGSLKRKTYNNIAKLGYYYEGLDNYYILEMDSTTTNNQCELLAIYLSLLEYYKYITHLNETANLDNTASIDTTNDKARNTCKQNKPCKNITIISDSDYSINCLTLWYKSWKRNDWKNKKNEPVKNMDIIKLILELMNDLNSKYGYEVLFIHQNSHLTINTIFRYYKEYIDNVNNPNSSPLITIQNNNKYIFSLGNYKVDHLVQT
jgi:ribonuclease HI/viroplasmin and RNaseH domain-containing protein